MLAWQALPSSHGLRNPILTQSAVTPTPTPSSARRTWAELHWASPLGLLVFWSRRARPSSWRVRRRARTSKTSVETADLEECLAKEPWRRGFEAAEELEPVELEITDVRWSSMLDLKGTIYRNASGRLRVGCSEYLHWFDGDGFVFALSIDGTKRKAAFASRFVRTSRFLAQEEPSALARAKEGLGMASACPWTPAANGDFFSNVFRIPTNPANTSVLWWGDRLLALCEGGLPYRLNPGTLETLGEALFTSPELSESGVFFFSAHPKRDASSGELFNIGITLGMPLSLEVYCCSAAGELRQRSKVPLKELTFVHDFAITEKYIVLILPPWVCPVEGVLQSLWEGGLGSKFQWQEDLGTRCVLLRRSDLSTVFDETLKPPVSLYHTVNAFDQGEAVVLQVAAHNGSREEVERNFQDMYRSTWTDETRCCLKELVLDISAGQISVSSVGPAEAASFELPTIHPAFVGRKHRHVFTNSAFPSTAGFANSIERLDLEKNLLDRARFDAGQFAGEPMILPKTGPQEELNAYVCTCVYDANVHKSFFAFFDAGNLAAGPVAKVHLPTHVPYSFHGDWVPGFVPVMDDARLTVT
ncbi:unnamed protein product [Durusdinium trenchii]|uniref:Carotenoid oxygenase n=1 Tax=Durusdinium trenchii TaxID=1381693 RepID=A0ABP0QID4_9DINO